MYDDNARRNEMSAIGEEAHCLDQEVSVAPAKNRQPRQAALTRLVRELSVQVQTLVAEMAWMKKEWILQLGSNPITS